MQDNFSDVSDYYAKYRPGYPKELFDFIFNHLKERNIAWDCATGSGQVARYLSEHFNEVYANDISPQQMSFAPLKDNIKYFNVPSENTGFPGDIFNLVTVAQAIHWFDFQKFYSEVKRTCRNNALLAVIGYDLLKTYTELDKLLEEFDNKTFGKYFSQYRKYFRDKYMSIPFPFKEIKTPEFKQTYNWYISDLEGFLNSWSSVQKIKKEDGYNPVDGFITEAKKYWKEDEIKVVEFPVFMRLGIVEKS